MANATTTTINNSRPTPIASTQCTEVGGRLLQGSNGLLARAAVLDLLDVFAKELKGLVSLLRLVEDEDVLMDWESVREANGMRERTCGEYRHKSLNQPRYFHDIMCK